MLRNNKDSRYTFYNWSNKNFNREMELLKNKRKEIKKILRKNVLREMNIRYLRKECDFL